MIRSFRTRLVVTVIALVAGTAAALAVASYVLVRQSLRDQLVTNAIARADFNIGVLAAADRLPPDATSEDFARSDLARRFQLRSEDAVFVEFAAGEPYSSQLALIEARGGLSPDLVALVDRGRLAYEFTEVGDEPHLVVAGRRPPAGPDFFFFTSAVEVEDALGQLRRVLIGAGLGLTVAGAAAARFIAGRVLRPVREASAAASTMAGGDLGVRIPVESADEFGIWARSFNDMAESLQQKVAALQEAQERERQFVADVSHELRTPLTALINEAALVSDYLDSMPDPAPRVGELLVGDAARMRRLVEDLLEISRLDAAVEQPERSSFVVARLIRAIIDSRHPTAVLEAAPAATVTADRRRIERIVGNLLDNARTHAPDAAVRVTAALGGGRMSVTVADDGPGVPEADLPRLFDRFYVADAARRGHGTGLGLAIAREHARGLGGDLTARIADGGGLEFTAEFPVTRSLHDGDEPETLPDQADRTPTRRIDLQ